MIKHHKNINDNGALQNYIFDLKEHPTVINQVDVSSLAVSQAMFFQQ